MFALSGLLSANLGTLHIDQNRLSGTLPSELGMLTNLNAFTAYGNTLTGLLPPTLGNWTHIQMCQLTWFQVDYHVAQHRVEGNRFLCPLESKNFNYACQGNLFCASPPAPPPPGSPPPPAMPPGPNLALDIATPIISVCLLLAIAALVIWLRERMMRRSVQEQVWMELQERESKAMQMRVAYGGETLPLAEAVRRAVREVRTKRGQQQPGQAEQQFARFTASFTDLKMGQPVASALGVVSLLGVPDAELRARMAAGVRAIEDEVAANGTPADQENLRYVLHEPAGSSDVIFPNSAFPRDHGRAGERLFDFVAMDEARTAQLSPAHVVALRLYTTSVYQSINQPLRGNPTGTPHPLPCTVAFLSEGIRRLRAVDAVRADTALMPLDLWRGLKDCRSTKEFDAEGGSEFAPSVCVPNPQPRA